MLEAVGGPYNAKGSKDCAAAQKLLLHFSQALFTFNRIGMPLKPLKIIYFIVLFLENKMLFLTTCIKA